MKQMAGLIEKEIKKNRCIALNLTTFSLVPVYGFSQNRTEYFCNK